MTVASGQIEAGTAAVILAACDPEDRNGVSFILASRAGTAYIGDSTTSGTTGYALPPDEPTPGHLTRGEAIYGVATSGTATVHVLLMSL